MTSTKINFVMSGRFLEKKGVKTNSSSLTTLAMMIFSILRIISGFERLILLAHELNLWYTLSGEWSFEDAVPLPGFTELSAPEKPPTQIRNGSSIPEVFVRESRWVFHMIGTLLCDYGNHCNFYNNTGAFGNSIQVIMPLLEILKIFDQSITCYCRSEIFNCTSIS